LRQRLRRLTPGQQSSLFCVLALLLTWVVWMPLVITRIDSEPLRMLGGLGPALAAMLLTFAVGGLAGLRALFRPLTAWRVHPGWYLFSFLSTALVALAAIELHVLLGGERPAFNDPGQWYLIPVVFLYVLITSVLGEEIGWRGYALCRLQARHSALVSSLILGAIWSVWHLPLFWMAGNFHQGIPIGLFFGQIMAFTILYTWMYNSTRGSLLMVSIFHAASNSTLGLLPLLPMSTGDDLRPLYLAVGMLWMLTLGIVIAFRPRHLSRRPRVVWPADGVASGRG
jgi:uncharacterized protein